MWVGSQHTQGTPPFSDFHPQLSIIAQEELAARAGIHRTYVSSIELGKVRLGLDIAKKVADGLGVTLSDLLADAESIGSRRPAKPKRQQVE